MPGGGGFRWRVIPEILGPGDLVFPPHPMMLKFKETLRVAITRDVEGGCSQEPSNCPLLPGSSTFAGHLLCEVAFHVLYVSLHSFLLEALGKCSEFHFYTRELSHQERLT